MEQGTAAAKKSQSRENRDLDRGRAPPTPPSGVPVAMRHPAAAAGLGGWNHGSPRWMGRGAEEEAIRERYQGLQGPATSPLRAQRRELTFPTGQGRAVEASESALGTMKRKVDDTLLILLFPLLLLSLRATMDARQRQKRHNPRPRQLS